MAQTEDRLDVIRHELDRTLQFLVCLNRFFPFQFGQRQPVVGFTGFGIFLQRLLILDGCIIVFARIVEPVATLDVDL